MEVNGELQSNGGDGQAAGQAGAGAGGSVWIKTEKLRGHGTISANGGVGVRSGSYGNGGGGGGRVAVYLENERYAFLGEVQAHGGSGTDGASGLVRHGHPGTVLVKSTNGDDAHFELRLDNLDRGTEDSCDYPTYLDQDENNYRLDILTLDNRACIRMANSAVIIQNIPEIHIEFNYLNVTSLFISRERCELNGRTAIERVSFRLTPTTTGFWPRLESARTCLRTCTSQTAPSCRRHHSSTCMRAQRFRDNCTESLT